MQRSRIATHSDVLCHDATLGRLSTRFGERSGLPPPPAGGAGSARRRHASPGISTSSLAMQNLAIPSHLLPSEADDPPPPAGGRFLREIAFLKEHHLLRRLIPFDSPAETTVTLNGKQHIAFCSNNYLGLATHPRLCEAAIKAAQTWGTGSGASRLISGNLRLYEQLEDAIARFKGCESALIFHSGYAANVGALSALIAPEDVVLFDRLNHASLLDGVRLSKGRLRVYRHKDMEQLQSLLAKKPRDQKAWIVTDGIFSMDGDIAPLPEIVSLAEQYDALIYLDDAHATGILGKTGQGTCEHFDITSNRIIQMGTFSKAFGVFGGFIAGSVSVTAFLVNKARSLIYTTALPPAVLAAAAAALDIICSDEGASLRERLWSNTHTLRSALLDWNPMGETPIIPLLVKKADRAVSFSERLLAHGIYIPAIRPPTVPPGQSRLRISMMATHSPEQINHLIGILKKISGDL